jgi:hypothetical protein
MGEECDEKYKGFWCSSINTLKKIFSAYQYFNIIAPLRFWKAKGLV